MLVVAAHLVVAGLLLLMERHFGSRRSAEAQLVYISPITLARPPPMPDPGTQPAAPVRRSAPPPASPQPIRAPAFDPEPITPEPAREPRIDWQRELERSVRESARDEEYRARYRPLDSQPEALELPRGNEDPPPGTVTVLPNGDKVAKFRVGDRIMTCTSPQVSLDEHFSVWAQFRPPRCTKPRRSYLQPPPERNSPGGGSADPAAAEATGDLP